MKRNLIITSLAIASLSGIGHATTLATWDFTQASNQTLDTVGSYNLTNGGAGGGATFSPTVGADFGSTYNKLTYDAAALNPATVGAGETWTMNITGVSFNVDPVTTSNLGYQAIWGNRQDNDGLNIYKYKGDAAAGSRANDLELWYHNGVTFYQVMPGVTPLDNDTSAIYDFMLSYEKDTDTLSFGVSTNGGAFVTASNVVGGTGLNIVGDAYNFGYIEKYPVNFTFDGTIKGASIAVIPEPGSMALLALGGLGLLRRRR